MVTEKPYTMTTLSTTKSDRWSTAPNGSSRSHDFYTVVTKLQTWTEGKYAGYQYKIVETWISSSPEHMGQLIGTSSSYHSGPAE